MLIAGVMINGKPIDLKNEEIIPYLEDEAKKKLPSANLQGKWSIDFMYDGSNFVLIDMGRAECSYYYDKVVAKQLALQSK